MTLPVFREPHAEQKYALHAVLFVLTVVTTLWAGAFWGGRYPTNFVSLRGFILALGSGVSYSVCLLGFLSVHEFGHYFAAMRHRVRASLPFYIPMPPLPFLLSLGTMGAVIKIRERIPGTSSLFDIGVSGPLSGFAVCVGLLVYGFLNLPPVDFIYAVHPEYLTHGGLQAPVPKVSLMLGKNLLWIGLEYVVAPKNLPPMTEIYHYPILFTGWLGSLVTALNLLPVGQLDGGHITYAMFGRRGHEKAARAFLLLISLLAFPALLEMVLAMVWPGGVSLIPPLFLEWSWPGWMLWAFVLWRMIGVSHPPTDSDHPLDGLRTVYGWVSIGVFVVTFVPVPFGLT